jgi:hypothetical protein
LNLRRKNIVTGILQNIFAFLGKYFFLFSLKIPLCDTFYPFLLNLMYGSCNSTGFYWVIQYMLVEKSSNGNQKGGFTISYIGMKELEGFPKSVGAEW